MMKNKKFLVILLLVFIIILLLFSIYIVNSKRNKINIVSNIVDINEAYAVKTCFEKFYIYCKDYRNATPKYIYELLDKDYIKYYNLSENNFKEKLDIIDSDNIHIDSVYKIQQKGNIALYIINSHQLYKKNNESKELNIILKLDKKNNTFSVFLNNYINDNGYNNLKIGDKLNIPLKSIKSNDNNKYDSYENKNINNIEDIFYDFRNLCMFYDKYVYNIIDDESKDSKFVDYEEYNKYITSNFRDLVTMKLLSYEYIPKGDYGEYRCITDKGYNIIFKVTSYVTYTVIIK